MFDQSQNLPVLEYLNSEFLLEDVSWNDEFFFLKLIFHYEYSDIVDSCFSIV